MHPTQRSPAVQAMPEMAPAPSLKRTHEQASGKANGYAKAAFSKIARCELPSPGANKRLVLKMQYEEAKKQYPHLFKCANIETTTRHFGKIPDVGMGLKFVAPAAEFPRIGTSGVCDCLAFCMRGQTPQGEIFLGMAHSPAVDPAVVIKSLTESFSAQSCASDTLSLYVIGGVLPHTHNEDGSVEDEIKVLSLSETYPVRGVRFNDAAGEESTLSIVLTADGLYFSKTSIFSRLPGYEEAGDWI